MLTSMRLARQTDPQFQSSVNELFQSTSRLVIMVLGGVYLALILATAIWPAQIAMQVWTAVPLGIGLFFLAYYLLTRNYVAAQLVLLLAVAGSITHLTFLFQLGEISFFYTLLPFIAVITLGWRSGILMELIIAGLLFWLSQGLLISAPTQTHNLIVLIDEGSHQRPASRRAGRRETLNLGRLAAEGQTVAPFWLRAPGGKGLLSPQCSPSMSGGFGAERVSSHTPSQPGPGLTLVDKSLTTAKTVTFNARLQARTAHGEAVELACEVPVHLLPTR